MRIVSVDGAGWSDERGWGVEPLVAAGIEPRRVGNVHVVSVEPGAVRGNHRHPNVTEWMLVCGGPATLAWRDPDGTAGERSLDGRVPVLAEFGPGVAHAVRAEGAATVYLVCYADGSPETERVERLL